MASSASEKDCDSGQTRGWAQAGAVQAAIAKMMGARNPKAPPRARAAANTEAEDTAAETGSPLKEQPAAAAAASPRKERDADHAAASPHKDSERDAAHTAASPV